MHSPPDNFLPLKYPRFKTKWELCTVFLTQVLKMASSCITLKVEVFHHRKPIGGDH